MSQSRSGILGSDIVPARRCYPELIRCMNAKWWNYLMSFNIIYTLLMATMSQVVPDFVVKWIEIQSLPSGVDRMY